MGAFGEKDWIAGKEGFGEQEDGEEEGDGCADCADVIIPLPSFCLT